MNMLDIATRQFNLRFSIEELSNNGTWQDGISTLSVSFISSPEHCPN